MIYKKSLLFIIKIKVLVGVVVLVSVVIVVSVVVIVGVFAVVVGTHCLQAIGQYTSMYAGLFLHSPMLAQYLQCTF